MAPARRAMLATTLAWLGAAIHCGSSEATAPDDGDVPLPARDGGEEEAAVEAGAADAGADGDGAPCDPQKPFATAELLGGLDPAQNYLSPRLSPDERTIYFTTTTAASGAEIATATRPEPRGDFGPVQLVTAINSGSNDNDPAIAADELSIWFHSIRNGNADLFMASRSAKGSPWGLVTPVTGVNSSSGDTQPYYRVAGGELWFASSRGSTVFDIWTSKRPDGGAFGAPTKVTQLSSPSQDWSPQIGEDGLTILWASDRAGGKGKFDLWVARRAAVTDVFGAPVPLAELNSDANDLAGWLSADGCRLYFSSGRNTGDAAQQLFFAARGSRSANAGIRSGTHGR